VERDMAGGRDSFDPQTFSRKSRGGQNDIQISKGSNHLFPGRGGGCSILHPKRPGQGRRHFGSGKEAVVGIMEAGQFFGEGCLYGHDLRIATTTAMEECLLTE
jgi:CRP/FNR family transcriptional regulator, cyclic AMP receptor protein